MSASRARRSGRTWGSLALAAVAVLSVALWSYTNRLQVPTGFSARYYAGSDWAGEPAVVAVDDRIATAVMATRWPRLREPFSVRWEGSLRLDEDGTYRFSVVADDRARLYLDDRLVIDNSGTDDLRQTTVSVPLDRGVHAVRLDYYQVVNQARAELYWSSRPRGPLSPLTGSAVSPTRQLRSDFERARLKEAVRLGVVALWTVVYWLVLAAVVVRPLWRMLLRHHLSGRLPAGLIALLVALLPLYVAGLTWGVPGPGWAPHEISPAALFEAHEKRFSNGWWVWYGPVHYYLLSLAALPLFVWRWLDATAFTATFGLDIILLTSRAVSAVMALGTVVMTYVTAAYFLRAWPALVAAAIAALYMPMVFYAQLANTDLPFVFWSSVALASFARIAVDNSKTDYVLFAVTGMLAVCTKDQAYGLYGLPTLAIAAAAYRHAPGSSIAAKIWAGLRDRHVLLAIAAGLGTFALAHNLLFNLDGFQTHLQYIQTDGLEGYRMYEPTVSGLWRLWSAAWMVMRVSVGWPAFLLVLTGLALSLRPWQGWLWWMLVPALSYFVTYTAVVRYTYDRFLMPVWLLLALAAGLAAERGDALMPRARTWVRGAIAAIVVYTFVYASAVTLGMVRDSRYAVEAWMQAHVEPGSRIGLVGGPDFMPRPDGFVAQLIRPTLAELESPSFDYIVLNLDWVDRWSPDLPETALLARLRGEQLAYRRVYEIRQPLGTAGVPFVRRFEPFGPIGFSTLVKINPPLLILKRVPGA